MADVTAKRLPMAVRHGIYSLSAVLRGLPGVERCRAHGHDGFGGQALACVFAAHNRHVQPCSWDMWWRP